MITRYLSALTASTLVTLAILFAMQGLIDLQPGAESEKPIAIPTILTRTRIIRDTPIEPPEPIDREQLTKQNPVPATRPGATGGIGFSIPVYTGGTQELPPFAPNLNQPDGPLICIVRVRPNYPAAATRQGLEGWVDVRFDVMTNGLTVNVEAVRSSHRLFEKAAIRAAERFRFKAPVVNGIPQVANGVEYRFRFDLEE